MSNNTRKNNVISFALVAILVTLVTVTAAVAQPVATPGAPIYVLPLGLSQPAPAPTPVAPTCCVQQPAPQGPCCALPLHERIAKDAAEANLTVDALKQLKSTAADAQRSDSSFGMASGNNWIGGLLLLALLGALVWALMRNRQHPAGNGQVEGNFLVVRHPLEVTANPVRLTATVQVNGAAPAPPVPPVPAPVIPSAPPAPVVPAPVPPAPRGTPCPNCGVAKPNLVARFCAGCGNVLPAILFVILLFGFGHSAMAQGLPAGDYRQVQCPGGVVTPSVCLQPIGVAAVIQYIPPTGNGPSAIVPTAPPAAPTAPRRRVAVPHPAAPALDEDRLAAKIASAIKAVMPIPAPAAVVASNPAPAQPAATQNLQPIVDRLTAVEQKQVQLAVAQNALVDRLVGDEAGLKRVGDYVNDVNDLAVKTAAGSIPKMSTHGGNGSPACQAYQAFVRQGGSGNPPKGCK